MRLDLTCIPILAASVLFTAGISPALSQDAGAAKQSAPLSLQDCINIALKQQTEVIVAKNNITIANQQLTQAKSNYLPNLSLQNNAFRLGSQGVLTSVNTGTALTVNQNIFDGGIREAQVKGARYGVAGSSAGLTRTTQTAVFTVTQAYYELLRSKHLSDVAASSVKYNEGLKELIQARVDVGDAASADVYPVEAQLANAKVSLIAAQNAVRTAAIQLQNTMGLSPKPDFDVKDVPETPNFDLKPLNTYVSTAVASRPDIKQSQANIGSAKASVKATRIALYPTPTVAGQYQKGVGVLSGSSAQIVGGISFDIFNGGANRAAYKQAKASQANAEQQSSQVVKDIDAQVQSAYLNLNNAQERLSASRIGFDAAQKNYDAQNERYKQGLAIPLDLLNAELQVVTAQTNVVQARYDYLIAIAQMEYAVGRQGGTSGS